MNLGAPEGQVILNDTRHLTIQRHKHHLIWISLTGICKKKNTNNINKISTSNKINGSKDEHRVLRNSQRRLQQETKNNNTCNLTS
jgi:predicted GNAT family N-acyltransferase